ncbi:MAG: CBS domain-containing protein [bacterium]
MKVRNVMKSPVVTIDEFSTYEEAAKILYDNQISGAPVIDGQGNLVGLLSEKDLFRVLFPFEKSFYDNPEAYLDFEKREQKINEIRHDVITPYISRKAVTIDPDTPIMKAGGLMLAKGIHRLPVLENGKVVGIVSRKDIFGRIFKNHLGLE